MLRSLLKNFLIFSSLISLLSPVSALAQDAAPQPQNVSLEINVQNSTGNLTGTVDITNNTSKSFVDGALLVRLIAPGEKLTEIIKGQTFTRTTQGQAIDYLKFNNISLQPGQKHAQSFNFQYPPTIISGSYNLIVEFIDADLSSWGTKNRVVDLSGSGQFLTVDPERCRIKVGGENYLYREGPNIKNNETGEASCLVKNTSSSPITAAMNLTYAVDSVEKNINSAKKIIASPITIQPDKEQTVSFDLPKDLPPQVYQGMFQMVNSAGQKSSISVPFRWILVGPAATIGNLDLDKTYYKQGETAKVGASILASPDLSWRADGEFPFSPDQGTVLVNPKVEILISDKNNQICGQKTENLPMDNKTWNGFKFDISINKECLDPKITAKVFADGSTEALVQREVKSISTETDLQAAGVTSRSIPSWIWVLIAAITIIIAAVLSYYFKSRKNKTPPADKPQNPSASTGGTANTVTAVAVLILLGTGYLLSNPESEIFNKLPNFLVYAQQDTVKQPINSSDATIKNVEIATGGQRRHFGGGFWVAANATDFAQNNTGGQSQISVEAGCSKINITVVGASSSEQTCENWGDGMPISVFLDGQPIAVENPRSDLNDELFFPIPSTDGTAFGNNSFDTVRFNSRSSARQASFSVTPSAGQRVGNHTLSVRAGTSYVVRHSHIQEYVTSLGTDEYNRNCGGNGPCYVLLNYNFACEPPPACNDTCGNNQDCSKAIDGCTECRPSGATQTASDSAIATGSGGIMTCQKPPPPACNSSCSTSNDCTRNTEGCLQCVAGSCQKPPACNISCTSDTYCQASQDGCSRCLPSEGGGNTCQKPPACNVACTSDTYCENSQDGCKSCLPSDTGTGSVCRPTPACNVACTKDSQCTGAKDGCTACVSGSCQIPPACGNACTSKAQCSGAKDGCTECLEGTCTDYNDNMCKCDGITAELNYPNPFKFEAFGKVEGSDIAKAEIADVTFRLTKDNVVVARSNPITPTVVENTGNKMRYKADWQTQPPAVDKNSTYRVFADVRCKPKRITTADASQSFTPAPKPIAVASHPPKGLELALRGINSLFGNSNSQVKTVTDKLLTMFSTSTVHAQDSNLQLETLNFVKVMDTDNCRFVMFKFDETLF